MERRRRLERVLAMSGLRFEPSARIRLFTFLDGLDNAEEVLPLIIKEISLASCEAKAALGDVERVIQKLEMTSPSEDVGSQSEDLECIRVVDACDFPRFEFDQHKGYFIMSACFGKCLRIFCRNSPATSFFGPASCKTLMWCLPPPFLVQLSVST